VEKKVLTFSPARQLNVWGARQVINGIFFV